MAVTRKPKDYVNKVSRSSHDLQTTRRTTMHSGVLVPIYFRRVLGAGDSFKFKPNTLLQSKSMIGPLMGSYKVRLEYVFEPLRNLYGWLDNNDSLSTEEILDRQKHQVCLRSKCLRSGDEYHEGEYCCPSIKTRNRSNVGYGSLFHYMGLPANYMGKVSPDGYEYFSLEYVLAYLDYWRTYHMNTQEGSFPLLKDVTAGTGVSPFEWFSNDAIESLFKSLRYQNDGIIISADSGSEYYTAPSPFNPLSWKFLQSLIRANANDYSGLLPIKYDPDIYTNLLRTRHSGSPRGRVLVSGSGSNLGFNIEDLRFQNALQRTIDRLDVSGGRFSNWMRTLWGVTTVKGMDIPQLLGVSTNIIDPQNITSTAKTEGAEVGQMQARTDQFNGNYRVQHFKFSEPGIFMICASIIPQVDYSQGIDWQLKQTNFADDYSPEFAHKGFDDVPRWLYSAFNSGSTDTDYNEDTIFIGHGPAISDTSSNLDSVVGRNISWIHEMSDVNRVFGEFAYGGLDEYMVLHRDFTYDWQFESDMNGIMTFQDFQLTQYINPLAYQSNFVGVGLSQPNWWLQVNFDILGNRPLGGRWMPALE